VEEAVDLSQDRIHDYDGGDNDDGDDDDNESQTGVFAIM
jgi:hypothetical protein